MGIETGEIDIFTGLERTGLDKLAALNYSIVPLMSDPVIFRQVRESLPLGKEALTLRERLDCLIRGATRLNLDPKARERTFSTLVLLYRESPVGIFSMATCPERRLHRIKLVRLGSPENLELITLKEAVEIPEPCPPIVDFSWIVVIPEHRGKPALIRNGLILLREICQQIITARPETFFYANINGNVDKVAVDYILTRKFPQNTKKVARLFQNLQIPPAEESETGFEPKILRDKIIQLFGIPSPQAVASQAFIERYLNLPRIMGCASYFGLGPVYFGPAANMGRA